MPVSQVFVAPGNGGTAQGLDKVSNVSIPVDDFSKLIDFAKKMKVNFVVPGQFFPMSILPLFFHYSSKHEASSPEQVLL